MKAKWFKEFGWIYLPVSWEGAFITGLILVFDIQVFLAVDQKSHSVSDTLYGIFPYLVGSLVVLFLIAAKTSTTK